jgi:ABC-type lipoprotein export system ATPase subunit
LYSLEFLEPNYEIEFENTRLDKLSPGQKGHLLFAFHLGLDKTKNPLLIDQPEENLDNQTIFENLVPLIQRAKQNRQIFIVTHNPNIAIACDAEQVIYANFDNKNEFDYSIKGSIECPLVNEKIQDILEGTRKAFDRRNNAYQPF